MSPFPRALADAQRKSLHDELVAVGETLHDTVDRIDEVSPEAHLVGMSGPAFRELVEVVHIAWAAIGRCEELTG